MVICLQFLSDKKNQINQTEQYTQTSGDLHPDTLCRKLNKTKQRHQRKYIKKSKLRVFRCNCVTEKHVVNLDLQSIFDQMSLSLIIHCQFNCRRWFKLDKVANDICMESFFMTNLLLFLVNFTSCEWDKHVVIHLIDRYVQKKRKKEEIGDFELNFECQLTKMN